MSVRLIMQLFWNDNIYIYNFVQFAFNKIKNNIATCLVKYVITYWEV